MQGMRKEKVILVGTLIEVSVVVIGGEYVAPRFVSSCSGGFCDFGMEEEDERKSGELGTELKPVSVDI
jgi:hypothetical protein